jgi:anti-sigma factor RsiW
VGTDIQVAGIPEGYPGRGKTGYEMSTAERPYITCHELLDFLYLYLEDELPEDRRTEFDRHLAVCDPCLEYIRRYQDTIRLGRSAYSDTGSTDVPDELVRAVLEARRKA